MHHPFSPSTLDRIEICPGSYHLCKGLADIETEDSKAGDKLHKVMVTNDRKGLSTDEEINIDKCNNYVAKVLEDLGITEYEVRDEKKLALIGNDFEVLTEGYPDRIIVPKIENFVLVFDWKFGMVKVDPSTLQNKTYGLSACQYFDKDEAYCHIVQPAINNYGCMIYQKDDTSIIEEVISIAKDIKNFKLVPSDKCQYCKAKIHDKCQAYKVLESKALTFPEKNITTATDEEITKLYEIGKSLEKKTKIVQQEIKLRIEKNGNCGNYYIKEKSGKKKVAHIGALQKSIENLISKKEMLDCSNVTIGKLEKVFIDNYKLRIDPKATKVSIRKIFKDAIENFVEYGDTVKTLEVK